MLMPVLVRLGYRFRMRPVSKFILVLASVSFLSVTLSGAHCHADAATHDDKAPHEHVHSYIAPPELDEDHIDISVFEPATEFSKFDNVALVLALAEFVPAPRAYSLVSADRQDPLLPRHLRWRPLLRGPPSSA